MSILTVVLSFFGAGCSSASIFQAVKADDLGRVDKLLRKDKSLANVIDREGCTPLFYARSETVAETLIRRGARIDQPRWGDGDLAITPMDFAIRDEHTEVVSLFLCLGVDPNGRAGAGRSTYLMGAAGNGNLEQVVLLLHFGADPSLRDEDYNWAAADFAKRGIDLTPRHHDDGLEATRIKRRKIIELLERRTQ